MRGSRGRSSHQPKNSSHSLKQQADGGDDRESEDHDFKGGLIHSFENDRTQQGARDHGQAEDGVEFEGNWQ